MKTSTLYNKGKLFPKSGNKIGVGIDKLVFDLPSSDKLKSSLSLFDKISNVSEDTGEINYSRGKLLGAKNIEVRVYRNYIRFTLNPVKEIYGSNFHTISKEELRSYITRLQDELDVNILRGLLRRIDLQATIKMESKPTVYFETLGEHKYLTKSNILFNTLYYNSKSKTKYKTLLFYDKVQKDKSDIPLVFKGGNYLRYEAQYYNRYLREIAKRQRREVFAVQDLFNDDTYNTFVEFWFKDYEAIYKEHNTMFNAKLINKPSDVDRLLANEGIMNIGSVERVCKMISVGLLMSDKSASFLSKVKSRVRDIAISQKVVIETPFLNELESKIKQVYSAEITSTIP